jgi:tetratricopeptide (TPR) repeat protein
MTLNQCPLHVLVVGALLWSACATVAHAQENPAASGAAPDVAMHAYRMRMDGHLDEAKQVLDAELAERPKNAAAWCELARLEFQRFGKTFELDSAQKAIEQAVAVAPDNARYHRWAGRIAVFNSILKGHGGDQAQIAAQIAAQTKKATAAAEQAVKLDADDHEARMLLVSLYGNNPSDLGGDQGRAEENVKIMETRSPVDGAQARCEFSLKSQPEKKLALWHEIAKEFGDDPRVDENLALLHAWAGNVEKATAHAEKALALDPSRGKILVDLARAFALEKKYEPAEQFAHRYLALDPPAPVALRAWTHMALGQMQQIGGNKEAATESFEKARQLDPYCWFTMTPPPEELFAAP